MKKNNYDKAKVKILGEEYTIKGDESSEYIAELADYVDQELKEIKEYNSSVSKIRIMILGMMNFANKLYKSNVRYENLKKENNNIERDYSELEDKYNKLKEKHQNLKEEYNEFLELLDEGGFE